MLHASATTRRDRRGRACAAGALALCAALLAPPGVPAQGLTDLFMSPADEQRVGAEQHDKVVAEFGGVYDNPPLAAYVDSIGQLLARTSAASATQFRFTILDSPIINAFALPGGYVYVTRGLIALADTEAELAGVIAHEIGHVAARHGAQRQANSTLANIGLAVLGIATDSGLAQSVAQVGAAAVLSSYSRGDEYEADSLGVGYLARAGFDPRAMAGFLHKLELHTDLESRVSGGGGGSGFDFFATHPRTADRVARAERLAVQSPVSEPIVGRDVYLDKIDGTVYGEDPDQGLILGNGRRFLHARLDFEFTVPPGFRLVNGEQAVTAVGPQGASIRFDGAARGNARNMIDYVRGVFPAKAQLRDVRSFSTAYHMAAATAVARADTPNGAADLRVVAIAYDAQRVYRFVFLTPVALTRSLEAGLFRTARGFRKLNPNEARLGQPHRIVVHDVQPGDTVDSLARQSSFPDHHLDRFLVLNGLSGDRRLDPGQRVKLVR